jgi:asparagine synthase (glutamine-hydrolysing)
MMFMLEHRGPDDWGMMFFGMSPQSIGADGDHVQSRESKDVRLAFGHRRLAILDLSPSGRQPMTSHDGHLTIIFNGEIYNYVELREELARNSKFNTGTDTEVLLEAYRQWGPAMLERLDGMFAFALWDDQAKKLVCARDPLGIKPFYYGQDSSGFYFASEPRGVLAGLGTKGHVDTERIAEFLVLGISDFDEGTSFREVKQLRGGQWFEVSPEGKISETRTFWRPPTGGMDLVGDVPALVRAHVDVAICRQLRSDVPVGISLSGGIDSGGIVASVGCLLGEETRHLTAFTLQSKDFDGDETVLAKRIADHAGVHWIPVEPLADNLHGDIEKMIVNMGEPFTTLSMLASYKVMERARAEGKIVMLNGQGGDEAFLGYPRVAERVIGDYARQMDMKSAVREWRGLNQNASLGLLNSLLGNVYFGSKGLFRWRNSRRIEGLVAPDLVAQVRNDVILDMFSSGKVQDVQSSELTKYILPRLLRYEDRNSMAFGLEARVPLLAVDLVNMALRLPLHWRVHNGWTKYALRMAMGERLPEQIVWNPRKRGYEVPQKRWIEAMRPQLATWLADLPQDSFLNASQILAKVDAGQGDAHWLWRCLSVALWMRSTGVGA